MPVFRLDDQIWFPDPVLAEDDGLLAVGGDLSTKRLLLAYTNGIFPWYNPEDEILWWCPKKRFLIFPDNIHISHSMKKFMKHTDLTTSINKNFKDVIHNCHLLREETEGSWITDEMEEAYNRLFTQNLALSVEVWKENLLVGGLYGVSLGRGFFGESMFSKVENASKLALISLAQLLSDNEYGFIDCQLHTDHLESMGGVYVSWQEYKELLQKYVLKYDDSK